MSTKKKQVEFKYRLTAKEIIPKRIKGEPIIPYYITRIKAVFINKYDKSGYYKTAYPEDFWETKVSLPIDDFEFNRLYRIAYEEIRITYSQSGSFVDEAAWRTVSALIDELGISRV